MKNRTFIIAEAGVNHNGSMELAKKLIDAAVEANVDAVKFQTFIAENVISQHATKAAYQKENTGNEETQLEMVKKLQLSFNDFIELQKYCNSKGIMFLSTPFDLDSIDFLATLKINIWKIPSGEITNLPYLKKIAYLNEKVILSTGMCTLEEIEVAINILISNGTLKENITILHCNTEYPTPMKDVNLKAMLTIQNTFDINVGYSDHTLGIELPIAAVTMGAQVIEKHFTLDKTMNGPDHIASLDPTELKAMVKAIRNIEQALGDGIKKPSNSEEKNINVIRKSLYFNTNITAGKILHDDDFIALRPGIGISPMEIDQFIGKKLINDVKKYDLVKAEDIL